jgi:amino acid adenylation domain-containing protein
MALDATATDNDRRHLFAACGACNIAVTGRREPLKTDIKGEVMTSSIGAENLGSRLAAVAQLLPNKIAITEGEDQITFGQLDAAATVIGQHIVATGQADPGVVCLLFENKLPAIKSIFGAGRSGYLYVPLDAGDPEERLRLILQDCEPTALLTEESLLERARAIAPAGCALIDIGRLQARDDAPPLPSVAPDARLYLIYTSGSTGQPKGVSQTHRNLLFFSDTYARTLAIGDSDRLSLLYTLSFAAANNDIFGGLLHGATVCAYDLRRNGIQQLADWLDRQRITVLHAVPTVFREMASRLAQGRVLPHLRAIDLGGESVFASDVELFRQHTAEPCIFVNQLSSTEVAIVAQYVVDHRSPPSATAIVPVGHCIEGVQVEILRDEGDAAATDEVGEIVVSSPYVSPGYWRQPDLDASAFSADPRRPGWRRYRSADFGHLDEKGNLHFLGRKGSRVKIRGHSVELMEIEAALSSCPDVVKAAVLVARDGGQGEAARLAAYIALRTDAVRDPQAIRRYLSQSLPSYMLPAEIVFVIALPLTASGKIDRKALTQIEPVAASRTTNSEPPQDDLERALAEVFRQLLKLDAVGRGDDFFLLGGDSLLGVELQIRLMELFGFHVTDFHQGLTVARIAERIRHNNAEPATRSQAIPVLTPLWRSGSEPPLFLIHGRHGQAFVSPHFMQLLGNNQPVWAFQARGLDGQSVPHSTVEAMAAEYLDEMRKQRPRGPYFLAALCAGAYIAAVMARSLRAAGETVLPLLLLDPPNSLLQGGYTQISKEQFVTKMKNRKAMGRTAGPVHDPAYMKALMNTAMAFEHAIAKHRPQPYDGAAYMLSSRQRMQGMDSFGIRQIFTGSLERFEVGTTHAEALDPRSPTFAKALLHCVGQIRLAAHAG